MNAIKQINDAIKAEYSNKRVSAIDGIAKQQMNGNDGLKVMIYSEQNIEPQLFAPDDYFDLQVAHLLTGGDVDKNDPFKKLYINNVDLIVISPFVKFYHILSILQKLGIQANSYDLRTRNVLKTVLNVSEEYPETEAYIIKYQFSCKLDEFETLNCC